MPRYIILYKTKHYKESKRVKDSLATLRRYRKKALDEGRSVREKLTGDFLGLVIRLRERVEETKE